MSIAPCPLCGAATQAEHALSRYSAIGYFINEVMGAPMLCPIPRIKAERRDWVAAVILDQFQRAAKAQTDPDLWRRLDQIESARRLLP